MTVVDRKVTLDNTPHGLTQLNLVASQAVRHDAHLIGLHSSFPANGLPNLSSLRACGLFWNEGAMAVVTTMSMPPILRWALARLPISAEEARRLQLEEFEAQGFVSNIERLLVAVDAGPSGQLASRLIGLLAGARRIPTTVLHFDYGSAESSRVGKVEAERTKAVVKESAETGDEAVPAEGGDRAEITTRVEDPGEELIFEEGKKGYGLLFLGREPASEGDTFHPQITRSVTSFAGPVAITIARGADRQDIPGTGFNILVPVTGTAVSRRAAELAIALAQTSQGTVTALHAESGQSRQRSWGGHVGAALAPRSTADAILRDTVRLGDPYGVEVRGLVRRMHQPADAILRQVKFGRHNLLVIGVSPRPGEQLTFGPVAAELLESAPCSVLFVAGEASASVGITEAESAPEAVAGAGALTPAAA